jgi:hypothetical protein
MATLEERALNQCNKLGYDFAEYDGSHFVVDTCDRRVFHTGNHWITAHINRSRNDALRFILQELEHGTHIDEEPCSDEDCGHCKTGAVILDIQ